MTKKIVAKKKISHTEQLRRLRADKDHWYTTADKHWDKIQELKMELALIDKIYPKKHYRLTHKCRTDNGNVHEYKEIIKGHNIDNAIEAYKETLIHPDSFELIDIELIA